MVGPSLVYVVDQKSLLRTFAWKLQGGRDQLFTHVLLIPVSFRIGGFPFRQGVGGRRTGRRRGKELGRIYKFRFHNFLCPEWSQNIKLILGLTAMFTSCLALPPLFVFTRGRASSTVRQPHEGRDGRVQIIVLLQFD